MTARVLVMALLTICLFAGPAAAAEPPERVLLWSSFGLAPDEIARFTLLAPAGLPLRAKVKLFDATGALVAMSDEATIQAGAFYSFEFDAVNIRAPGEPRTGRRQLRASGHVRGVGPGASVDVAAATLEILAGRTRLTEITDGTSNTLLVGERPPSSAGAGRDLLVAGAGRDILVGIVVPEQFLRVTVAHVDRGPGQDQDPPAVNVGVWVLDASGRVIGRSADVSIPREHFHVFDFDRDALPGLGDLTSPRVQLHTIVAVNGGGNLPHTVDPGPTGLLLSSAEVVQLETGATAARVPSMNNLRQIGLGLH